MSQVPVLIFVKWDFSFSPAWVLPHTRQTAAGDDYQGALYNHWIYLTGQHNNQHLPKLDF